MPGSVSEFTFLVCSMEVTIRIIIYNDDDRTRKNTLCTALVTVQERGEPSDQRGALETKQNKTKPALTARRLVREYPVPIGAPRGGLRGCGRDHQVGFSGGDKRLRTLCRGFESPEEDGQAKDT